MVPSTFSAVIGYLIGSASKSVLQQLLPVLGAVINGLHSHLFSYFNMLVLHLNYFH